ncbi:MAG: peptidoglycan DD-metalloendopeptidase family protein [Chloroflexi bacterium]|nr:peptidoglycan DD-metalloendopeptidase family protein [Chloroflexota bacterium]MBU1750504.1 peptidoglycan DD-metalloendopeptidase family protein [Chloroflexota bacterium]
MFSKLKKHAAHLLVVMSLICMILLMLPSKAWTLELDEYAGRHEDWVVYTDDAYGFSLEYPKTWSVFPNFSQGHAQGLGGVAFSSASLCSDIPSLPVAPAQIAMIISLEETNVPTKSALLPYIREQHGQDYMHIVGESRLTNGVELVEAVHEQAHIFFLRWENRLYAVTLPWTNSSAWQSTLLQTLDTLVLTQDDSQTTTDGLTIHVDTGTKRQPLPASSSSAGLLTPPSMLFPWDSSLDTIRYTGGPHGSPWIICGQYSWSGYEGIDFGMSLQEVLAVAGGSVQNADWDAVCGYYVIIDHGGGWTTHYWHLDGVNGSISPAVSISQGRLLGISGNKGSGAGGAYHLHLSLRHNGTSYSWNGVAIDGWKVRSDLVSGDTTKGYNYQGTMTQGGETLVTISECEGRQALEHHGSTSTAHAATGGQGTILYSSNHKNTNGGNCCGCSTIAALKKDNSLPLASEFDNPSPATYISASTETMLVGGIGSLPGPVEPNAPGGFDQDRVLCDSDLLAVNSMSESNIQDLLDGRNSFFINYYDPQTGLLASHIIYTEAQNNQISPKLLLAKMQQESSSIWSWQDMSQLVDPDRPELGTRADWVLFYGWPDSDVPNPAYKGFYNQVHNAAQSLRNWFDDPGAMGWAVGQPHTVSDGTVTPANAATCSLYIYTPWIGSNNLLWQVWWMMWGDTGCNDGNANCCGCGRQPAQFTTYRSPTPIPMREPDFARTFGPEPVVPIGTHETGRSTPTPSSGSVAPTPSPISTVSPTPVPDTDPPSPPADVQSDAPGSTWSNDPVVQLHWTPARDAEGSIAQYLVTWDRSTDTEPDTTSNLAGSTTQVTSPPLETGRWYAHLRAVDEAGNTSSTVHVGPFLIDVTAPDCSPTTDTGEPVWQNDPTPPTFTWQPATDIDAGVSGYRIYWGDDPAGQADRLIAEPTYNPPALDQAIGAATRYLRAAPVDGAGNQGEWTTVASWRYDGTRPTATLDINNGAKTTQALNVALHLSAEDSDSSVAMMRFSHDDTHWTDWEPYAPQRGWTLPAQSGKQTVYGQVRDGAGNESAICQSVITVNLEVSRTLSTNYQLVRSVVAMGGGRKFSDNYQVQGTWGQAFAGEYLQSNSYQIYSGYWSPVKSAAFITISISLESGWNLVSIPIRPVDTTIGQVLAPIAGNYDLVYAYDGCDSDDPWKKYDPDAPPFASDLTKPDETKGFWINILAADTLVVTGTVPSIMTIPLCTGWNLVGYPSFQNRPVTEALASIAGQYVIVYAYDASDSADPWKKYDPNAPPFSNDLTEMQPDLGYWIQVSEDCVWTVNN